MNTLTNTKLNNYTIDDFIKLKPIIFEYCINLTMVKSSTFWIKRKDKAEDLYHDVYLNVYDYYFNKPKELMEEGKFIQIMKNHTYWTFHSKLNSRYPNNVVFNNIDYFEDSDKSYYLFQNTNYEHLNIFNDITTHPDYNLYTKGLSNIEKDALKMVLQGYTRSEIARKYNKPFRFTSNIINIVANNAAYFNKRRNNNHLEFVKSKIYNFDKVFIDSKKTKSILEDDRKIKIYSLYLQKYPIKYIANEVSKSCNQIGQEIFRINKKINSLC